MGDMVFISSTRTKAHPGPNGLFADELVGSIIELEHAVVAPFAEQDSPSVGDKTFYCVIVGCRHERYPLGSVIEVTDTDLLVGEVLRVTSTAPVWQRGPYFQRLA